MSERSSSFKWVKDKYGVEYSELDKDAQGVISDLGEEGVEELVKDASEKFIHRGDRLTGEERINLLESISRLVDFDEGGDWAEGESSFKGDKPKDWIGSELKDLSKD